MAMNAGASAAIATGASAPGAAPEVALAVRHAGVCLGARQAGRDHARWVLRGVSLEVRAGETVALVGPSGAGKSTLARAILGWQRLDEGEVWIGGRHWSAMPERERRKSRRTEVQMIYQDPGRSLDPALRVGESLAEAGCGREAVSEWLERVGLEPGMARRWPHELSGGQRQRVAMARAFACGPRLLVADEPTSALDTVAAAQIVELLGRLRRATGLACLVISHQLPWVQRLADRVVVLAAEGGGGGQVVETGGSGVLADPQHRLTEAMIAAVPRWPV